MVGRADLSSSDKGKTGTKFQQEPFKMFDQPRFQFPLAEGVVQGSENQRYRDLSGYLWRVANAVAAC
jgi:hypothetical protein